MFVFKSSYLASGKKKVSFCFQPFPYSMEMFNCAAVRRAGLQLCSWTIIPKKCFSSSNWQNIPEERSKCYCCILISFKSEVRAVHWWVYEEETPRKGKGEPSALNHCSTWISLCEAWTAHGMGVAAFPEQHYLLWLGNWDFHGGVSSEPPGSLCPSSLQWPGDTPQGLWVSVQIPGKIRKSQEV